MQFNCHYIYTAGGNAVNHRGSEKSRVKPNRRTNPLPRKSSFSRGASSHVAASLFRYQGRIVRIDCIRAQLLASLPRRPWHAPPNKNPQLTDNGFYNLIKPSSVGWSRE